MKFKFDLSGQDTPVIKKLPVYNASSLSKGAALVRGVTGEADHGALIVSGAAATDVVGVLENAVSSFGVFATGTLWNDAYLQDVCINPSAVYEADYDQADTMVAVSSSSTTATITSLEDDIDGGWLYVVSGTGAGQLRWLAASASGSCTTLTAFSPVLDGTSYLIKILPNFHKLVKLNSTATKIGTDAAAGSGIISVLENFVRADGINKQRLDPALHSGLNLYGKNAVFSAEIVFCDHLFNQLS